MWTDQRLGDSRLLHPRRDSVEKSSRVRHVLTVSTGHVWGQTPDMSVLGTCWGEARRAPLHSLAELRGDEGASVIRRHGHGRGARAGANECQNRHGERRVAHALIYETHGHKRHTLGRPLQGEELAHLATEPAREARARAASRTTCTRASATALPFDALYVHQRDDVGRGAPRRARHRHDGYRVRQDARVQPARARRDRARPEAAHALPLPDEGARAGSGAHARRVQAPAHARRDLRRRHARRAALADPPLGEPHPHEPGHAPRRRPAAPRPLGRRALEPALRRRRRGARVPRRLRLARRERAAPAAAARARLRRRAAVPARVRDDREPRRARAVAARRRRHRRRSRRRAARRADDRALEPAAPRRGARPARVRDRRGVAALRGARLARPADDLLREEPPQRRAHPPLHGRARRARDGEAARARTAPATRRSSGATSSGASSRASCSASRRRTRSSSASTSACSTARSPSASPARSRRSVSSGDAPAAAATGSRC